MRQFKITEALSHLENYDFIGNREQSITGAIGIEDSLHKNSQEYITWVSEKIAISLESKDIKAGLLVLNRTSYGILKSSSCNFLIVENPRSTFFSIVNRYFQEHRESKIESSAIIDSTATIGKNCYIGHHVIIEQNCKVGDHTSILHNSVILKGTTIGNHVKIGCNNTIGNYGFGYEKDLEGTYFLLEHLGNVVIEDNVEIHNNTCIDRGVLGTTHIHDHVKIDNLVHIAHGVVIERNSLIIANAMIAGSAIIGENTWIAPSVSVKNKITIAPNTMTGIGAVILKNTQSNMTYIGNPAVNLEEYKKWSDIKKSLEKNADI